MSDSKNVPRVREPVQVYLDGPDLDLLDDLVMATGLTKAELYRRGPEVARGVTTALLEDPAYQWLAVDAEVLAAAGGWLERFRDQRLTLCDAVSFESMRRERIKSAFAFNQHFELAGFKVLVA